MQLRIIPAPLRTPAERTILRALKREELTLTPRVLTRNPRWRSALQRSSVYRATLTRQARAVAAERLAADREDIAALRAEVARLSAMVTPSAPAVRIDAPRLDPTDDRR